MLYISLALEVNGARHKFHHENEKKAAIFKLPSAVLAACKRHQTCSFLMVLHSDGTELAGRSVLLSATWTFESVFFFPHLCPSTAPHNPGFSVWIHTCTYQCLCSCCSACLHLLQKGFRGFFAYRNRNPWLFGKIKKASPAFWLDYMLYKVGSY